MMLRRYASGVFIGILAAAINRPSFMVERLALKSTFIVCRLAAAEEPPKAGNPQLQNDAERVFLFEVSFPVRN
jgi:hypothetical protein